MKTFTIIALALLDLVLVANLLYENDQRNFYENLLMADKVTIITHLNAEEPIRTWVMQCGIDIAYSVGLMGKSVEVYSIENGSCFYYYSGDLSLSKLEKDRIEMCYEKMNAVPSVVIVPFGESKLENTRLTIGVGGGNQTCSIKVQRS
ncbi:MAG: hypothetical protein QW035_02460 [Candidatus Anstonellales archaeon]